MTFINLYEAPIAEWIDRGKAVAAVQIGLRTPAYSSDPAYVGPFGEVGRRLGVVSGDRLIAIDGRALPADNRLRAEAMSGKAGVSVVLTLQREDGTTYRARVVRSGSYERDAFIGSGMSVGTRRLASFLIDEASRLVGLIAAVILFLRRPRDPVAMVFCVAMLLNAFPVATSGTMWPGLGGILVIALAQFSLVVTGLLFPHGRMTTRWHWIALAVAVATFADAVAENNGNWTTNWWSDLTILSLVTLLAAVVAEYRSTPEGIARQQFKPVAFGVGVWIAFFLLGLGLGNYVEPHYSGEGVSAWLKFAEWMCYSLAWMGLPVGLLVALSRYRLYDADAAISASVAYGAVTALLLATFGGSENIVQSLGSQYLGQNLGAFAPGIGAAVAAAMLTPIHARVSKWTENRLRGPLLRLRQGLPLLVGDLREVASPETLARATLDSVAAGVYAKRGAVVTGDEILDSKDVAPDAVRMWQAGRELSLPATGQLDIDPSDPLFPQRVPLLAEGIELQGWLLVGPRPDGSRLGGVERAALVEIAGHVARALAIARSRQAQTKELNSMIAHLVTRIETLELDVRASIKAVP